MWGIVAGLLRFVPYMGSFLAAVAPAALAAAVDPGWTMTIEVIALFAVVEPITGYVVGIGSGECRGDAAASPGSILTIEQSCKTGRDLLLTILRAQPRARWWPRFSDLRR